MDNFSDSVEGYGISKTQKNSCLEHVPNSQKNLCSSDQNPNLVSKSTQTSNFESGSLFNYEKDDISSEYGDCLKGTKLLAAAGEGRVDVIRRILENDRRMIFVADPMGDTALHLAARAGNCDVVLELIKIAREYGQLKRMMVEQNVGGDTPLHLAIDNGHLQVARYLIVLSDLDSVYELWTNVINKDGKSPLMLAEQYEYEDLLLLLSIPTLRPYELSSGVDIEMSLIRRKLEEDMSYRNDIWSAIEFDQQRRVMRILSEYPSSIQAFDINVGTVFHVAARGGKVGMIRRLVHFIITNNPDACNELAMLISMRDRNGDNPLFVAIKCRKMSATLCLIEVAPQAVYQVNNDGVSPMYHVVKGGHRNLLNYMIDQAQASESTKEHLRSHAMEACLAHAAIKAKHLGILQVLMEKLPYLINSSDDKGWKPLSYAASKGNLDQVNFLIKKFPNCISKYDKDGSTPIHKAIAGGHILIVKVFIAQCTPTLCDIDHKGRSTLHIATIYRKTEILSHLLQQEDIKKVLKLRDKEGKTFGDLLEELKNRCGRDGEGKEDDNVGRDEANMLQGDQGVVISTTKTKSSKKKHVIRTLKKFIPFL